MKRPRQKAQPPVTVEVPTARDMLSALGKHIHTLRPDVTPKPKAKQISAARATATAVNSSMGIVRTSIAATKAAAGITFLTLEEPAPAKK